MSADAVLAVSVTLFVAVCAAIGARSLWPNTPPRAQHFGTAPVVPASTPATPLAHNLERTYAPSARHAIHQRAAYPLLRFIAACLKVVGWIFIAVAAIALVVIVVVLAVAYSQNNPFIGAFSVPVLVSVVVATLVLGLLCVALSELIRVFVDIAMNTHQLLQVALNYRDEQKN